MSRPFIPSTGSTQSRNVILAGVLSAMLLRYPFDGPVQQPEPPCAIDRPSKGGADEDVTTGMGEASGAVEGQPADGRGVQRRDGVNARTLSYWKWRLGKEASGRSLARPRRDRAKGRARPKPKFVEVTAALPAPSIELVVGTRLVVRVPDGFEVETLRRVMTALDGAEDRR